jgi:hypothetical protein
VARPSVSQAAEDLYTALKPLAYADEKYNWSLLKYCESVANPLQAVHELYGKYAKVGETVENYLTNPSVELDIAPWGAYQNGGTGTATRTDEIPGYSGDYCVKLTATSAINDLGLVTGLGSPGHIPVVPGEQWTVTGHCRPATVPRIFRMIVAFYTAANVHIISLTGASKVNASGVWSRANDFTMTAPVDAAKMTVYIAVNVPASGESHYVDAIMAKKGTSLLDYADGDSRYHEWEGDPHNSRTIKPTIELVEDGPPYWSALVDIDRCPALALPWLAQMVGVVAPPQEVGESDNAYEIRLREYIRATPGFSRGSPGAMMAAAQQFLTGTKSVIFRERDTGAYRLTVRTKVSETPDEAKVLKALLAQKPAGIVLDYDSISGQDYQLLYTNHPNYQDAYGDYPDYDTLYLDL